VTPPSTGPSTRGIVRLLNTAGGAVLCLAGDVDGAAVEAFLRRYGREPARIDGLDAGSVTALSASGLELVRAHLEAAERGGRPVAVVRSPVVGRLLGQGAVGSTGSTTVVEPSAQTTRPERPDRVSSQCAASGPCA
jgi:hypothetical protein